VVRGNSSKIRIALIAWGLLPLFAGSPPDIHARGKDTAQYGAGLIVNVPFSENEVSRVVEEVVQNGLIRGTKEYDKEEFLGGAQAMSSTRVFPDWTEGGKVFYKVRLKALDPRNFKNTNDVGTVAVRYVVQSQDEKHTVLRIDARFVEDFRHESHPSNGSVEAAEYNDVHSRLESLELMKKEATEAKEKKQESSSRTTQIALADVPDKPSAPMPSPAPAAGNPVQSVDVPQPVNLEQRVHELRREVERIVKTPGAPLKSAPFHTAKTLQSLPGGAEVLVVISTPYWYGVETHDHQHGWILRNDLELVP